MIMNDNFPYLALLFFMITYILISNDGKYNALKRTMPIKCHHLSGIHLTPLVQGKYVLEASHAFLPRNLAQI